MSLKLKSGGTLRRKAGGVTPAKVIVDEIPPTFTTFTVTNIGQHTALVSMVSDKDAQVVWDIADPDNAFALVQDSGLEWIILQAGQLFQFVLTDLPSDADGRNLRIRASLWTVTPIPYKRLPRPFVNFTTAPIVAGDTTPPTPSAISVTNITTGGCRANCTVDEEGTYTITYERQSDSVVLATQNGTTTVGANSVDLASGLYAPGGNVPMRMRLTVRDTVTPTPNSFTAAPVLFNTAVETVATNDKAVMGSFTFPINGTTAVTGNYDVGGEAYIVAPVGGISIGQPTPVNSTIGSFVVGGAQVNPMFQGEVGYDARLRNWNASARASVWPRVLVPGDVIIMARPYLPAPPNQRDGLIGEWGVCHIVAAADAPAAGAAAPAPVSWTGRGAKVPTYPDFAAKVGGLPKRSMSGMTIPTKAQILERIGRNQAPLFSQIFSAANTANVAGYEGAMVNGMAWNVISGKSYGEHSSEPFEAMWLYLCSNAPDADKIDVMKAGYCRGRDAGEAYIRSGTFFRANGAHYQGFWIAVLLYLWIDNRLSDVQNLKNTFACNPLDQPIKMTAERIAQLVPHSDPTWPFTYRLRQITAISGTSITVQLHASDPAQVAFTGLLMSNAAGTVTTRCTGQPDAANEALHSVASAAGFSVGDQVYFRPDAVPAVGSYDWQIHNGALGVPGSLLFNPAQGAPYRELNQHLCPAYAAHVMFPGEPAFEALIGYARASMLAAYPNAANDHPSALARTQPLKHFYYWMTQFWNSVGDALFTGTATGTLTLNQLSRDKIRVDAGFAAGLTTGYITVSGTGTAGMTVQGYDAGTSAWNDMGVIPGGGAWTFECPVSIATPFAPNPWRVPQVRLKEAPAITATVSNRFRMAAITMRRGQSEIEQTFLAAQSQTTPPTITDDDRVEFVHTVDDTAVVPITARVAITNAAPRSAALARSAQMWIASGTTLDLVIIDQANSGTSRRDEQDDALTDRRWEHLINGSSGLLDVIRADGVDVGLAVEMWDNADRGDGLYFGKNWRPLYTRQIWDTGIAHVLGATYERTGNNNGSSTYTCDHCLYDFNVAANQFGQGVLRRERTAFTHLGAHNYICAKTTTGLPNTTTITNIEQSRTGRKNYHDDVRSSFFKRGPTAMALSNGELDPTPVHNVFTDPTHPSNDVVEGLELLAQYMTLESLRRYGVIDFTLPEAVLKTVGPSRAYIDLRITGPAPLTTTRIKKGLAFPASPAAHHKQIMGFWVNGAVTGFNAIRHFDGTEWVIRLTKNSGNWVPGDTIQLLYSGAQANDDYDFTARVHLDFPIADNGIANFPGLSVEPVPFSPLITVT